MNLASLLQSMGVNLADVENQAKTIVNEMKSQIESLHAKIDTINRQNIALASAMIELDKKLDVISRIVSRDAVTELIDNGHSSGNANDRNRGNSNGSTTSASSANGE